MEGTNETAIKQNERQLTGEVGGDVGVEGRLSCNAVHHWHQQQDVARDGLCLLCVRDATKNVQKGAMKYTAHARKGQKWGAPLSHACATYQAAKLRHLNDIISVS